MSIDLTNPGVQGWVSIPNGFKFFAPGYPMKSGKSFNYKNGSGWVFLSDKKSNI